MRTHTCIITVHLCAVYIIHNGFALRRVVEVHAAWFLMLCWFLRTQTHEVFEPETKVEAENTAFTEEHTATEEIKAEPQSVEDPGVEELSVDAAEKEVKADVVCTLSHEAESVQDEAVEATADEVKVECDEAEPVEAEFVLEAQAVTQCATPQLDPDRSCGCERGRRRG